MKISYIPLGQPVGGNHPHFWLSPPLNDCCTLMGWHIEVHHWHKDTTPREPYFDLGSLHCSQLTSGRIFTFSQLTSGRIFKQHFGPTLVSSSSLGIYHRQPPSIVNAKCNTLSWYCKLSDQNMVVEHEREIWFKGLPVYSLTFHSTLFVVDDLTIPEGCCFLALLV